MAKVPVEKVTLAAAPSEPAASPRHLSPFSWLNGRLLSVQPPAGFWSVIVSAYSWPETTVTPSSAPAVPELTRLAQQLPPTSGTYGRLVNATSPTVEVAAPPSRPVSPFQSCQAQKLPLKK